jgi:hypothetical protein
MRLQYQKAKDSRFADHPIRIFSKRHIHEWTTPLVPPPCLISQPHYDSTETVLLAVPVGLLCTTPSSRLNSSWECLCITQRLEMASQDAAKESSGTFSDYSVIPASITNSVTWTPLTKVVPIGAINDASSTSDTQKAAAGSPAVRFASVNEEIPPNQSLNVLDSASAPQHLSGATEAELRALSTSLRSTHLQNRRMSAFNFEPVSLPASRVCQHIVT